MENNTIGVNEGKRMSAYVAIVLSLLSFACNKPQANVTTKVPVADQGTMMERTGTLDKNDASWKWKASTVRGRQSLEFIQMLNATQGWAASTEGSIYKSNDGGDSWDRVKFPIGSGWRVRSLYFVTPELGWVVCAKTPSDVLDYEGVESSLFMTRDSGTTWTPQFSQRALELNKIHFVNAMEGWAVGSALAKGKIIQTFVFVLHTSDQGQHWEDRSDKLNGIFPNGNGSLINILAETSSRATLLATNGQIVRTSDAGQTWNKGAALTGERDQNSLTKLGQRDDQLWVVGGAYSIEGIWGLFAHTSGDGPWIKYRTNGVFFHDAVFVSTDRILASGSTIPAGLEFPTHGERDAAIFYSSDGGKTWAITYRTSQAKSINALWFIDANHIWAVGDSGLMLRLSSPIQGLNN